MSASVFIDGQWCAGEGAPFYSLDPVTAEPIWQGNNASEHQVERRITSYNVCYTKLLRA